MGISFNECVRVTNEWLERNHLNERVTMENYLETISICDVEDRWNDFGVNPDKDDVIYSLYYYNEEPFKICTLFIGDKENNNRFIGGFINNEFKKNETNIEYVSTMEEEIMENDITGIEDCI